MSGTGVPRSQRRRSWLGAQPLKREGVTCAKWRHRRNMTPPLLLHRRSSRSPSPCRRGVEIDVTTAWTSPFLAVALRHHWVTAWSLPIRIRRHEAPRRRRAYRRIPSAADLRRSGVGVAGEIADGIHEKRHRRQTGGDPLASCALKASPMAARISATDRDFVIVIAWFRLPKLCHAAQVVR